MSDFRATAHLQEQLGEERWKALIDSANTGKVKEFCNTLLELPTEMTVGGRTYEIFWPLEKGHYFNSEGLIIWAKKLNLGLHNDEMGHILKYQHEIPSALCGRGKLLFPDDRHPGDPNGIHCIYWNGKSTWLEHWDFFGDMWGDDGSRFIRRKS